MSENKFKAGDVVICNSKWMKGDLGKKAIVIEYFDSSVAKRLLKDEEKELPLGYDNWLEVLVEGDNQNTLYHESELIPLTNDHREPLDNQPPL